MADKKVERKTLKPRGEKRENEKLVIEPKPVKGVKSNDNTDNT